MVIAAENRVSASSDRGRAPCNESDPPPCPLTIQIVGKAVAVAVVARVLEAIASLTDAGDRYLRRDPRQEAGRGLSRRAVAIVRQGRPIARSPSPTSSDASRAIEVVAIDAKRSREQP